MVISAVSLSLETLVLDVAGLKDWRPLWWKEHASSQALQPLHLLTSVRIYVETWDPLMQSDIESMGGINAASQDVYLQGR
jgi:hypothetical protein